MVYAAVSDTHLRHIHLRKGKERGLADGKANTVKQNLHKG